MKKLFTAIATLLAAGMTVAAVSAVELEKVESSTEFSARETAEVRSTFNAENELTLVFFENFDDMETGEKINGSNFSNTYLSIGNVGSNWQSKKSSFRFWMGDNVTQISVLEDPDPSRTGNAMYLTNESSIKMVEIEANRKKYDLSLNKAGKYNIRAKVFIPSDSSVGTVRMTLVTNSTDNNGRILGTVSSKGTWKEVSGDVMVGPNETDTVIKTIKFWHWPGAAGGYWLDDIEVNYYGIRTDFYTDESKSVLVGSSYCGEGERLAYLTPTDYSDYIPKGKMLIGFHINGGTEVYGYGDAYVLSADDARAGSVSLTPVYADTSDSEYGSLVFFENFEAFKDGAVYSSSTAAGAHPKAFYIAPAYSAFAQAGDFSWTHGETGTDVNAVYDSALNTTALKLNNSKFPQVFLRRSAQYRWGDKGSFTNKLNTPGIYTIKADFYVPEGQKIYNVRIWTYDNRYTESTTDNPDERLYTEKSVSASSGNWITVTYEFTLPDEDNGITDITRFAFLAQAEDASQYCYLDNVALYYREMPVPVSEMLEKNSIRFGTNKGIRFAAVVDNKIRFNDQTKEIGFLVTRRTLLEANGSGLEK